MRIEMHDPEAVSEHGPVRILYQRPVLGFLTNGGGLHRALRTIACADCGASMDTTSPNARRCAECAKKRQREMQAAWMRRKRGQK